MTAKTGRTAFIVLLGILLCATLGLAAQSAGTKPIAFDDFIGIKRVTDPQLSPDGTRIAFVVTVMDKAANRGVERHLDRAGAGRRAAAPDVEPGRRHESPLVARRPDDRLHLDALRQSPGLDDRPERRRGGPAHPDLDGRFGRRLVARQARTSPSSPRSSPISRTTKATGRGWRSSRRARSRAASTTTFSSGTGTPGGTGRGAISSSSRRRAGRRSTFRPGDFDVPPIALGRLPGLCLLPRRGRDRLRPQHRPGIPARPRHEQRHLPDRARAAGRRRS